MSALPKVVRRSSAAVVTSAMAGVEPRVLIVGTGLTGSLSCYHLRALSRKRALPLRIDVADMARGPGGRMSTTRYGPGRGIRANTGAQYLSTTSSKAAALLESVCASAVTSAPSPDHPRSASYASSCCPLDRVAGEPLKRSTHFALQSDESYTHWLPREGTNSAVKQFLYGGEPDLVLFESRLQRMAFDTTSATPQLVPLFDSGGMASAYDVVILAMPPKDIMKFFINNNNDKLKNVNAQSQADLHRRTNRGKTAPLPRNHQSVALPPSVLRKLRTPSYVGRYSLVFWFQDATFAEKAAEAWSRRRDCESHPVIDMVSAQEGGVLVAQSTVDVWRRLNNSRGGGRAAAKAKIVGALEDLAGGKLPRPLNSKLLNWRTSQVEAVKPPAEPAEGGDAGGVVTAEGGRLIFTGDWCFESSFEGCNLAAEAAAAAAVRAILVPGPGPRQREGVGGESGGVGGGVGGSSTARRRPSGGEGKGEGKDDGGGLLPAPHQPHSQHPRPRSPTQPAQQNHHPRHPHHLRRVCSGPCGESYPHSAYSKNQWNKAEGHSRCKGCVAGTNPRSASAAGGGGGGGRKESKKQRT